MAGIGVWLGLHALSKGAQGLLSFAITLPRSTSVCSRENDSALSENRPSGDVMLLGASTLSPSEDAAVAREAEPTSLEERRSLAVVSLQEASLSTGDEVYTSSASFSCGTSVLVALLEVMAPLLGAFEGRLPPCEAELLKGEAPPLLRLPPHSRADISGFIF